MVLVSTMILSSLSMKGGTWILIPLLKVAGLYEDDTVWPFKATSVDSTVQVVDSTKPSISLVGDASMTISYQSSFVDPGATATDNYDNNITSSIH